MAQDHSQNSTEAYIDGQVLDKGTGKPIPYANISNTSLKEGTISNDDGFFKLRIKSVHDSVIGKEDQSIRQKYCYNSATV